NVIAVKNIASGSFDWVRDNALTDLPVGRALFEIQLKSDTDSSFVHVTAADLIW
ncbi:unnamed protein product, partial [marine sediment metagenome]